MLQARDGGHHGGSGVEGAIKKLDQQFQYLISHISSLIGPAKYSLADDCQQNYLKTKTFGWSILGGGLLDTASDFFGNFRSAEVRLKTSYTKPSKHELNSFYIVSLDSIEL